MAATQEEVRLPDGALMSQRDAPVGGQAVLEGVMMRGVSTWALAVRRPDGDIHTSSEPVVSIMRRHRLYRLPIVRGVVALVESMKIGFKALGMSANEQMEEDEKGEKGELSGTAWGLTIAISLALGIGLFFIVPVTVTNIFKDEIGNSVLFVVIEKIVRISIFLAYLVLISRLPDLRRTFEYHGAEHKTIACYEADDELTPQRARLYSRLHLRCGTSFLLIVMVIAVFVFAPIGTPALWLLILSRMVGLFLVAGLAYEVIKWAGKNRRKKWVRALMWPGLQLQKLTTREPDEAQLAVAIAALEAVLAVENPAEATAEERLGLEVAA